MGSAPAPKESNGETGMVIDWSRWSVFSLSAPTDVHMAPVTLADVEAQPSPLEHMCRPLNHHCFCHDCRLPVSWCAPPTAMTLGFSSVSFSASTFYSPGKFPRAPQAFSHMTPLRTLWLSRESSFIHARCCSHHRELYLAFPLAESWAEIKTYF